MKPLAVYKLFFLLIILSASLILFAYNYKEKAEIEECSESGKKNCIDKKTDSEFIILESIVDRLTASN